MHSFNAYYIVTECMISHQRQLNKDPVLYRIFYYCYYYYSYCIVSIVRLNIYAIKLHISLEIP